MDTFKTTAMRFSQNEQKFLAAVLPFHIINHFSEVLVYGESEYGYQREAIRAHYSKITKYLTENEDAILPTAVILGADKVDVDRILRKTDGHFELHLDHSNGKKLFRIVDGQHRIRGIEEAAKQNTDLLDFPLNVIVLILESSKRSVELGVFTDINSKSKRIKVDLAELAKHNYELLEEKISKLNRHIAIKVGYRLKEEIPESTWQKGIKFDIHSDIVLGAVGVTAFSESIEPIVDRFLSDNPPKTQVPQKVIEYTEMSAKQIAGFVNAAWDEVKKKWPQCFKKEMAQDLDGSITEYFYDVNYYVQKTLGVKALNGILGDLVKTRGLNNKCLEEYKRALQQSKIKSDDWATGGLFSGMSSESGFNKAKKYILNELRP